MSERMREVEPAVRSAGSKDSAGYARSEKAKRLHRARGKLLVRERINRLLDPGTPFLELSPLAADGMYEKAAGAVPSAGIVTGIGVVAGTPCVVSANDSCVKGGTYFPMTNKKALRAQELREEVLQVTGRALDSPPHAFHMFELLILALRDGRGRRRVR